MKKIILLLFAFAFSALSIYLGESESLEDIQAAQLKHMAGRFAHKDTSLTGDTLIQFKLKKPKQ